MNRLAHLSLKLMLAGPPAENRQSLTYYFGSLISLGITCSVDIGPDCHIFYSYMYIYTSNGVSLHEFAISLLKGRKCTSNDNDDLCIICADGGKLVLCDGCPRAFHKGGYLYKHVNLDCFFFCILLSPNFSHVVESLAVLIVISFVSHRLLTAPTDTVWAEPPSI